MNLPTRFPDEPFYKEPNTPHETHHWYGEVDAQRAFNSAYLAQRAKLRLNRLLCGDGLPGAYGLGQIRTLDDFIAFSGIDYKQKAITDRYDGLLI